MQQIYLQFCIYRQWTYALIFSSDTLQVFMFVCHTISELRFDGCCHPCLSYIFQQKHLKESPKNLSQLFARQNFKWLWRNILLVARHTNPIKRIVIIFWKSKKCKDTQNLFWKTHKNPNIFLHIDIQLLHRNSFILKK